MIPTEPPVAKYVAMGDSFSSGEGVPPFEAGTAVEGVNECHRSSRAYSRLLAGDPALNLSTTAFVACSGASTSNILEGGAGRGGWGQTPQIDSLSSDTELATITIGGNDVGFKEFAIACTIGVCNFSTSAYATIISKIENELPEKLEDVLDAIATRISSIAKVYVIGYPHISPPVMPTGANSAWPLNGQSDNPDAALNDGATIHEVTSRLNSTIAEAVEEIDDSRIEYVDPNMAGSPFIGHDWCKQDKYFNIVTYNNIEHSFHPNSSGQAAYKTVIQETMD